MNYPFRSAPFGGFNRQDVLDYLEDSARDSAEKAAALTRQLEDARSTLSGLNEELSQMRAQNAQLSQDNQSLSLQLTQMEESARDEAEALRGQLREARDLTTRQGDELESLRKESQELREKVAWMEPEATAYAIVKSRMAGIELEAHRRAQLIENQSREEAEALRTRVDQETEELRSRTRAELDAMRQAAEEENRTVRQNLADWLSETTEQYFSLCSQMKSAMAQADEQLNRAKGDLTSAASLLDRQRQALTALSQPAGGEEAAPEEDTTPAAGV